MFKKVNNWHLLFLVGLVSIFSVFLVQKYVLAAWQEPASAPGGIANQNIVLNPMTANLDLNSKSLIGNNVIIDPNGINAISISNSANLCLGATCKSAWPADPVSPVWNTNVNGIDYTAANVGIGTALPSESLHVNGGNMYVTNGNMVLGSLASIKTTKNVGTTASVFYMDTSDKLNIAGDNIAFNDLSGNTLMYLDDLGTIANLGIGTTTPNKALSIVTPTGTNPEINLQVGTNTHWGMYQDEVTGDLRFWNGNDRLVIDDATGYVGIGTSTPQSQLHVESIDQNAIYAKASVPGKYGLYAENTGVAGSGIWAQGYYGIFTTSNQVDGAGIISLAGTGSRAGYFFGDVELGTGNLKISAGGVSVIGGGVAVKNGDVSVSNGYIQFPEVTVNPPDSSCASVNDVGKAVFNSTTGALVICNYKEATPDPWKDYNYAVAP